MIDHEKTRSILTTMASKRSLIKLLNLIIPKLTGPSKTSRYSICHRLMIQSHTKAIMYWYIKHYI